MGNKLKAICSSDECLSDDVPLEEREISKLYPTVILKSTSSSMFESESGSILQEHNICLNGRKFKKLKAQEMIKQIKEWRVQTLKLMDNFQKSLIKQIRDIGFPALTEIYLSENAIQSIQQIHQISMPQLKILDIGINRIHKINNMKKGYWPKLKQLDLYSNIFIEVSELSKISSYELSQISIQWRQRTIHCQNAWPVMKLPSTNLNKIYIKERTILKRMITHLNKRYPYANVEGYY